ncbi:hypothetical protein [Enterococcus sp. LJL90]
MDKLLSVLNEIGFRKITILIVLGLMAILYFANRKKQKKIDESDEDLANYSKNQDGLYPWEVDQDDSPKRVASDARPVKIDKPRRGRW